MTQQASESIQSRAASLFMALQDEISQSLEALEPDARFKQDIWERSDIRSDIRGGDGGGGMTRILANGGVFEKAGVNFSKVYGHVSADFAEKLGAKKEELPFFATGVSLVIHPRSPMVPTTHANWRYLELGGKAWFGGGSDLTPYYLEDEDAIHFHSVLKEVCDKHDKDYYPRFKEWCDRYFYLPHRGETRGIGGIFFDHLGRDDGADHEALLKFVRDLGFAFTEQYVPIVKRRIDTPYGEREREFQLLRRGRYVEFNLLYDRGTHFGLQTGGRTESILMSLPPLVRWDYCPDESLLGGREGYLLERLKQVREWVGS